jgi:hypothetical protein
MGFCLASGTLKNFSDARLPIAKAAVPPPLSKVRREIPEGARPEAMTLLPLVRPVRIVSCGPGRDKGIRA